MTMEEVEELSSLAFAIAVWTERGDLQDAPLREIDRLRQLAEKAVAHLRGEANT